MPLSAEYLNSGSGRIVKNRPVREGGAVTFTPSEISHVTFTAPTTADADGASVSHAGAGAAGTRNMTLGGALASGGIVTFATPRNCVIVVTHASAVVAMSGTITGTDQYGNTITEAWSVTAGTTSKTFTGKKAFKTITQITETVAADASTNTIIAGEGVVLGLPFKTRQVAPLYELVDGVAPTPGVLVAGSTASTADYRGTYTPNAAPNGTRVYEVWFITENAADVNA